MYITVYEGKVKHELPFEEGETVLTALQNGGIQSITAPCGGNGSCKKCGVNVRGENGSVHRLACMVQAEDRMIVEIVPEVRMSFADTGEGEIYAPTPGQSGYAAACDIGTTTVVCQLLDLKTGELLQKVSGSNLRRIFGGDVLSRLKAAQEGRASEIHDQIIYQINYYLNELCREAQIRPQDIRIAAVTGNTIMMHFFAGLDPSRISTAPFVPVSLFGEYSSIWRDLRCAVGRGAGRAPQDTEARPGDRSAGSSLLQRRLYGRYVF